MADPDHLIVPSIHPEDGEERIEAVGLVDGKLYTAVFVWRGDLPPQVIHASYRTSSLLRQSPNHCMARRTVETQDGRGQEHAP